MIKQQQKSHIQVSNLRLKFPGESSFIFRDLSFTVPHGQKILLLGPSGCGKSTLLQVLSGLVPNAIEVPLKYDSIQLPQSWGFVFQDPDTQFCMPYVDEELAFVLENLCVPRDHMEPLIEEVLVSVGLRFSDLHTPIGSLSQGMKQRLALASVLLLQPDVLFLDEPSALLDPEGMIQIWDSVKELAASKTVIIVEHKINSIVDWVDRVVLFNGTGEIIGDGLPQDIFQQYKQEFIEYGIWYPEVWDDYVASPAFKAITQLRQTEREVEPPSDKQSALIRLTNFIGYHGKAQKISIHQAELKAGEWITIIGENGAGKSTFLLSLMQLLRTTGTYKLDGEPVIASKRSKVLPNGLSLVFQNPELQFIMNSIYEEVAYSLRRKGVSEERIHTEVKQLLETFSLHMNESRHPYQLSMGQKRRLSVATALTYGHRILLLDEPTFGQDAKNTFAILEMLERLRSQGTTIVLVTHDKSITHHFATAVWTIDQGKLANIQISDRRERDHARAVLTS